MNKMSWLSKMVLATNIMNLLNVSEYSLSEFTNLINQNTIKFSKFDVGKYAIVQKPRKDAAKIQILYLVDRTHTKSLWWSDDASLAMVFDDRIAAENQASKYHYNGVKVIRITESIARLEDLARDHLDTHYQDKLHDSTYIKNPHGYND